MRKIAPWLFAACAAAPAVAHHSSALIYDRASIAESEGTITEVLWANPHVRLKMRGAEPGGVEREWEIESNSVSTVSRFGLSAEVLAVGTHVKLAGNPGRTQDAIMWVTNLLLPSGEEVLFGNGIAPRWSQRTIGRDVRSAVASASSERTFFRIWTNVTFPPSFWGTDLPLTAAATAKRAAFDPVRDTPTKGCTPKGMPFIMEQPYPMQIVDAGDAVLLRMEEYDAVRRIELTPAKAAAAPRSIFGRSVGRWDDGALVVRTTDIDYAWFNGTGIPQSSNAVIDERFELTANGTRIEYAMTVTDPATFTEPVTLHKAWEYRPGEQVRPYDCKL
jgi:hypothetical protein